MAAITRSIVERFPRIVPLVFALLWTGISLAILVIWHDPEHGIWHWVRLVVSGLPLLIALSDWWDVFLMPSWRIRQIGQGAAREDLFEVNGKKPRGKRLWIVVTILVVCAVGLHFWRPDIWW